MKLIIILLCMIFSSCVEFRFTKGEIKDQYIGNANTKPQLDPRMGPKAKLYLTNEGSIRLYVGGEILHRQDLLFGVGMIEYLSASSSLEIGIRDSIYHLARHSEENEIRDIYNPWLEMNPMFFVGGVTKW